VGEEGKLFGSVTAAQIAELLEAQGVSVDRRKLELAEPIKDVGEHRVPLRLHREVVASVRLNVRAAE
jgi:large subunit ribosomal protein L9